MALSRRAFIAAGAGATLAASLAAGAAYYRAHVPSPRPVSVLRKPIDAPAAVLPAPGPLRVLPANPRYFTADGEHAVLLVGSHTWSNFQDSGHDDPPAPFDYDRYLDVLEHQHHNFFRLWMWEQARWAPWLRHDRYFVEPLPWARTGPGVALDGKPKFDLEKFNDAYFERLRARVIQAGERGIYASIMLFDSWSLDNKHGGLRRGNPWQGHPFHGANNVNGIDGDQDRDGYGDETHEVLDPRITALQDRYVEHVIDTVGDLDNVLYEISNESWPASKEWEYRLIDHIKRYESGRPKQHPVGFTVYVGLNVSFDADLFGSNADWVAPNNGAANEYIDDPPPAKGDKVVVLDTDHLWGIGGNRTWAWKAFLRGYNILFMDSYDGAAVGLGAPQTWDIRFASWGQIVKKIVGVYDPPAGWDPDNPAAVELRAAMGDISSFARRMPLAGMTPRGDLASSGYCLAGGGHYLAFAPEGGARPLVVDLTGDAGPMRFETIDTRTGKTVGKGELTGGSPQRFDGGPEFVVHVHKAS